MAVPFPWGEGQDEGVVRLNYHGKLLGLGFVFRRIAGFGKLLFKRRYF
jgi:hypothetical protein